VLIWRGWLRDGQRGRAKDKTVAQFDLDGKKAAAQIKIAISQAKIFVGGRVFLDLERRSFRLGEEFEVARVNFDSAGWEIRVDHAFGADDDIAGDADDILAAQVRGDIHFFGGEIIGMKDDLRDAVAIAKVDEQDAAVIAVFFDPAIEGDCLAGVIFAKFTAGVGAT